MPRIRSIKPDFFKSRAVRRLNDREKLVWIGLWCYADDEGRLVDEPGILVGELWALELTARQIDTTLNGLSEKGRLIRYSVDDEGYIQILGWEHQRISNPSSSGIPTQVLANDSGIGTQVLRLEGKGGERKGGERPPTPHCVKHPEGTDKPCRACGDARRRFEAWKAEQKNKPTSTPRRADPKTCKHKKHPTEDYCVLCDQVLA